MRLANFEIVEQTPEAVTIRDIGPWDQYPTITNSAEEVVEVLSRELVIKNGQRLLYWDSENELTELLHKDGLFMGFKAP
jgi:hypothetical protein